MSRATENVSARGASRSRSTSAGAAGSQTGDIFNDLKPNYTKNLLAASKAEERAREKEAEEAARARKNRARARGAQMARLSQKAAAAKKRQEQKF